MTADARADDDLVVAYHGDVARMLVDAETAEATKLFDDSPIAFAVLDLASPDDGPQQPTRANRAWSAALDGCTFPPARTIAAGSTVQLRLMRGEEPVSARVVARRLRTHDTRVVVAAIMGDPPRETRDALAAANAARAEADRANRLKDRFLAIVSHELRTPLTAMLLWDKVLRDRALAPDLHDQAREAIHASVVAQARIVEDLLDIARASSGKLFLDRTRVDLAAIARAAIAALAPHAAARTVAVECHLPDVPVEITADATRLRQVLDNLLANALKFTEPGGRIAVTLAVRDGAIELSIADTGCGIAPELLERIFEPFSQIDDAPTRRGGGLGLGLGIARQLVELHGGKLSATSAGLGRGARMCVTLPAPAIADDGRPSAPVPAARLAQRRILVIDDDRRVREALAVLLAGAGATVALADSVAAADAIVAAGDLDLAICDLAMPEVDGYAFLAHLRATGSTLPVIALTAHALPHERARTLAAGFDVHVAKPIDFDQLAQTISELIAARGEHRLARG